LNFKSCATGKPACFRLACISRGSGRKRGVANKIPRSLKLAVIDAAAAFGSDGKGNAGLTGYLFFLAGSHPQAFAGLLGKTLPYQINTNSTSTVGTINVGDDQDLDDPGDDRQQEAPAGS